MSFHAGIDIVYGIAAMYNESRKETINYKITTKIIEESKKEEIEKMYKEIKARINGKLGFACIYLPEWYGDEIRINLIEKGKEYGFVNIEIINSNMYIYLNYISQIKQKPKNGYIIWIYRLGYLYIWKKLNSKAKMVKECNSVTSEEFIETMQKEKSDNGNEISPDILIYKNYEAPDLDFIKKLFPKCQCFEVTPNSSYSDAALIKARTMANNEEVLDYDIQTQLFEGIDVKINENIVMSIKVYESLPFEKVITIDNCENVFKIFINEELKDEFQVTPPIVSSEQYEIVVKIDSNRIITIDYAPNNHLTKERTTQKAIENGEKNYHGKTSESSVLFGQNSNQFMRSYIIPKKTMATENKNAVGIDLGTSRCYAAVNRRNGIETIPLDNSGERPLPSYVSINTIIEMCGQIVVNRLQNYSKSIIFDSKRIIGRSFSEVEINENWPFDVVASKETPLIKIQTQNGPISFSPEEIAAVLLKHIKKKAEEIQGRELDEVVITVPASFNEKQKNATHDAGTLAEWETVTLLPEPIAAAIAYFVDRPIPNEFIMLLFDFGGGTLDVCVMNVNNENLNIINMGGDSNLGGRDFDNILFNHFSQILEERYSIKVNSKDKLKYLLLQKCMSIKHTLSSTDEDLLDVSDYNQNIEETLKVTRQQFERISFRTLNRVKEVLISTLSASNYTSKDIHKVLLVGGGCRMPMVQHLLRKMFAKAEHCCEENPDEVVAIGAAYYAAYLNSTKQ